MFPIKKDGFELRPWEKGDAPSLARYANNKHIWDNVRDGFPHPYTEKDAMVYIDLNMQLPYLQNLAIIVDGHAVGGVGIVPQEDIERFNAELGYWIGEPYWNKGIVSQVVESAVSYFFSTTELIRIYAIVFESNEASKRILEKNGFRKVGIMEKAVYKNERFFHVHYYEILK